MSTQNIAKEHSDKSKAILEKLLAIEEAHLAALKELYSEFESADLITMDTFRFLDFIDGGSFKKSAAEYKPTDEEIKSLRNLSKGIYEEVYLKRGGIEDLERRIKSIKYYIEKAIK